ncbi:MAG: T9SS type A sorting domain-containing protein, partial [Candidatus Cloacimonetes bacterium]|nr:T9SS type A sorting domain-containing protein [Candidatus Cloacimonadota bacterium]
KMYWNGYKNGPERWSYVEPAESGHSQSVSSLSITTYPNPASYGDVRIKIKSPEEQNASVKIFNLSAELLFSDSKNLEAGINNEFVWNIADVTSGVYFARLKVGNNEKLIKIGVTK